MKKRKEPTTPVLISDYGKVPPQAIDMEEAVLGAIILDKNALFSVMDILKPESFYKDAHQKIFAAIQDMAKRNFPIDLMTVTEELRVRQELEAVGGPVYITILSSRVASSANIEYHSRIVAQKYLHRELIRFSTELQSKSFDDSYDVSELFGYAETSLLEISGKAFKKKAVRLGAIFDNVINTIAKIQNGEIKLVGVPSGFVCLDRATAGFKKQELTIIAGRPSMGKTALAVQIARNAATLNYPVAFFSLEMGEEEIGRRFLSGCSGKTNIELLQGKCNIDMLYSSSEALHLAPLYIDDTSSISLTELRAKVRRLILEHGIKLVIVDYLQLMTGEGDTREQEVSSISRGLKAIAKDMDIPVIALSQLNRRLENAGDKRPNLSDLRESGAIEQDADIVQFVYRPEKYDIDSIEIDGVRESTKGLMVVIIGKNRNGPIGEIKLRCSSSLSRIYEDNEVGLELTPTNEEPPFTRN